ncbi:uncharacterized protein bif [Periplaneta americana]|uniref:uncharacterized protein bif n=1 Tax=Periplaneta americana TaxID=6978 RepID=UPI0037E71490
MATASSQENGGLADQSIPQWKRELILRRRALARTLPAGNTSVKLTCPSVVTAVRHPELAAAGENVSGKQQRCISSAIASNKGVLDQTQADFHPRGRISDSSSGSTVSALVVGNMRLVEHQVDGDTDLMINGVGFDIAVEQSSVKYRSRMGEEKYVKKASASRTTVDNCVVNMAKNHLVMSENNNCQHSNGEECESDSSEELQYGPGIVNKLKCRYMSMTLRENQNKGLRPSLSNMRRATSLENMLDNDSDAGKPQITQHRFTKRTDATNNSTKAEHTSQHQQRYRPTSRRNDSMKRARSVETLLRYDPKSHTATGHSIPSDLPICDRVVKSEFRDCNKNTTKLLKALGNEEIVIVENKMKVECSRKSVGEEKLPMFQQKKRTTNIPEETELPPPDVVKQTLKIFEGTPTRKSSRLARTPGVTSKSAAYKHSSASLVKVNNSGNDNGILSAKPLLSPKPVLSPEKNVLSNQSPRKLQLSTDGQHTTSTPTLNTRVLTLDTVSSPFLSPVVSPTGTSRLKSPSPTDFPRLSPIATEDSVKDVTTSLTNGKITPQNLIAEEKSSSSEDEDDSMDGATKTVSSSALDNIRKDGTSMEFKFSSSSLSMAPKSYLPGTKNYLPTGNTTIPSKVFNRNQKVTSPVLERQDFVTKSTSAPPVSKSPDSPQIQMKQVGVIRPIVNNAHPTSPPPSLTNREIEKNFINRTKSIEQPTSRVVVSLKPADDVVVGKVSMESVRGRLDDSVKSARDSVTLRSISDSKSSGLWDKKPWNQPQNTMVFDFSGRKGPVPSYIENDGMVRPRTKLGEKKINVDGTSDESSTDGDADDYTVGFGGPPSPCNVLFEGDNILINGKSNLLKQPKQHKLRIKFNDAATTTFEYPSEASLLNETTLPSSASSSPSSSLPSQTSITAGLPVQASPSGPTPGVPVPLGGSSLASYTPSKIHLGSEDFQLGVTRAAPLLPPRTTEIAASSDSKSKGEEEEDYLKPAEDSETVTWSSETASDLLF